MSKAESTCVLFHYVNESNHNYVTGSWLHSTCPTRRNSTAHYLLTCAADSMRTTSHAEREKCFLGGREMDRWLCLGWGVVTLERAGGGHGDG